MILKGRPHSCLWNYFEWSLKEQTRQTQSAQRKKQALKVYYPSMPQKSVFSTLLLETL